MRFLKWILTGLSLSLALIFVFTSCGSSDPTPGTETAKDTSGNETGSSGGGAIDLVYDGKTDYQIVRSDTATDESPYAMFIKNALSALTDGGKVGIVTDFDESKVSDKEIIIGSTTRKESQDVKERLGSDDFRIEAVGEKIVIVAKDLKSLGGAVKYFASEVLHYHSAYDYQKESRISIDARYSKTGEVVQDMQPKDPRNPDDILIYTASVADYGAVGDGFTDDTKAFQNALLEVYNQGGGTVYVPAGQYLIKGSLTVNRSCYLAGAWTSPETDADGMHKGTVLIATGNAGSDKRDKALITVGASAGVMGLTIFYPEQNLQSPVTYPPAIRIKDNLLGDGSQHAASIQNVTVIGGSCGVSADEGLQLPYLNDVYLSVLDCGFRINKCYDCARITKIHISPEYWARFSGIDREAIAEVTRARTTGLILSRTDMQMMYDVLVDSCKTGITLSRNRDDAGETAGYSALGNVRIINGVVGVLDEFNSVSISGGEISCFGQGASCVTVTAETKNESSLRFYGVTFKNPDGNCINVEKGAFGIVSAQNSTFASWKEGGYAVLAEGGVLSVTGSSFEGSGKAFYVTADARSAAIGNNRFGSLITDEVTSTLAEASSYIETDSTDPDDPVSFDISLIAPPRVAGSDKVYNVIEYGARADGKTDDTEAFEKALAEAGKTGGIVYAPAGHYCFEESLTVPSGVEIRGISEGMHVSSGEGTVFLVKANQGKPDAEAFVTLDTNAGIRGVMFWYPEQAWNDIRSYPFAICADGENCVIRNICLGNCYNGIDLSFADTKGHYVENITGCVLHRGIVLDGSTGKGRIYNTHFNLTFYTNLSVKTKLTDASGSFMKGDMFAGMLGALNENLTAYVFGETVDEELLFVFNYRARYGMDFTGGFGGTIVGCAVDGSLCGIRIKGSYDEPLTFIAFSDDIVPGNTDEGNLAIYVNTERSSEVHFISSGASSYNYVPQGLVHLEKGILSLDGFDARVTPESGKGAVHVGAAGEAYVNGIVFQHVGRLDASGKFTAQSENASTLDIVVDKGGKIDLCGAIGVNFFKVKSQGSGDTDAYAVAK